MKTCRVCKVEKDLVAFGKNKNNKDGLMFDCKPCNNARAARHGRQTYNPEKGRVRAIQRHGLTVEKYNAMLEEQQGLCAICVLSPAVVIDHDHACCTSDYSCGECVRSLLCQACNQAIGLLRENPTIIANAARYVTTK